MQKCAPNDLETNITSKLALPTLEGPITPTVGVRPESQQALSYATNETANRPSDVAYFSARPKILIVDDNQINLVVLAKVLESVNAILIEATNGHDALAATLDNDFALAILDVQMPNMDGYELAERMRGGRRTQNIPIMFVTAAYGDEFHMFRSYQAGGVDYLIKPYQPEVLLAKVRIFLELDHDRRELKRHRDRLEEIVTDRVRDIDNLNKMLNLIRNLDQIIVHEKSATKLLASACDLLADAEDFSKAWIILKSDPGEKIRSAQTGVGTQSFKQMHDGFQLDDIPACGKLAHEQQDIIVASQLSSCCDECTLLKTCRPGKAMVSHIAHQQQHYGWIFVSLPDESIVGQQKIELFRQIANDLGFALSGISTQHERDQAARRLHQTNRKLVKRNEEIQYFYHSLAHELKTPLTSAIEFLSFVTEGMVGDLNETQAEYLGFVHDNCSNLTTYINDLLDVTRLDTGKLSLIPEPVLLRKLILQVASMMQSEADRKNILLSSELDEEIQEIDIDKSRITQVLFNILTNALKFTPANGSIIVKLYRDAQRPDWIEISVTDTGRGIPASQLPYIFRRYFQCDTSDHEQKDGFGLGLYLSSEIIKLHGGEIRVKSSQGNGSTFQLSLPVRQQTSNFKEKKKQKAYVFSPGTET